ncbi:MAG: cardiolipin synthase [Eubacteriaceae bacterium]|nr:cardiolipin synthase [Eubacteriaceae bacterium]
MIIKKAISRLSITVLLLGMQIAIFAVLLNKIVTYLPVITISSYIVSILIVLALIQKDEAAAFKVTWIIIIMGLPISGGILYLLFGNKHPTKRIASQMEEHALISKLLQESDIPLADDDIQRGRAAGSLRYIRNASSYYAYGNTETKYYPMGELMFEDMLDSLMAAKHFIFIEFFIIAAGQMWDAILDVIEKKAASGVDVRIIFDDLGSLKLFTRQYADSLRAKNIKLVRFSPIVPFMSLFMNNRNHRKIVVIDGHTAYNGGLNIADEYINIYERFGVWKDTGIRLRGEAVWSYTLMFIETWNAFSRPANRINDYVSYKFECAKTPCFAKDGFVLPFGDSPLGGERLAENIYIDILNRAEKYVYIFTPYLVISEKMIYAIQMAAKRGVDVRIVTPGIPDKKIVYRLTRTYYRYLLEAGVRIFEYSPGFLHAKSFVSDDCTAVVGTVNLDYRSLYLHFECAALLLDVSTITEIREDSLQTMAQSKEVLSTRVGTSFFGRILDAVLHLFAPLF